jgi:hypothetical protein
VSTELIGPVQPEVISPATRYLTALVTRGASAYVENAHVTMEAFEVDGRLIPLVINDGPARGNTNVCSAYAHYHDYAAHEFARRFGKVASALLSAPRALLGAYLRLIHIDRIVYVNNWLFATNPRHGLTADQIAELTKHLTRRFPDSVIVFRSLNRMADPAGLAAIFANDYRLVPSRQIYLVDTASGRHLERGDFRNDFAMLRKTPYAIVTDAAELAPHVTRIAELYRDLYLRKHSRLNPHYNAEFFAMLFNSGLMNHRAFIRDGRVDALTSYIVEDGLMTAVLTCYDLDLPRKLALYRMAFVLMIAEAGERRMLLNLSAGVGEFKMLRGAIAVQEYDAVYDRHLPRSRRIAWSAVSAVAGLGQRFSPRSQLR